MASIMDFVEAWERDRLKSQADTIDGHSVAEIIWETARVIVFRDMDGKYWRRVHAWEMTWPVIVGAGGIKKSGVGDKNQEQPNACSKF